MRKRGSVSFIVTALMVAAFVSLFASTTYSLQSRAIDKSLDNAGVQKIFQFVDHDQKQQ